MTTIIDLYQRLFGKNHITDGSVIDMSEHGRSGGVSTGQGFKHTKEVDETFLLDEATEDISYSGWAPVGSDTTEGRADARWKIKKIDTTDPNDQKISIYADGNENYDNVWNDRAELSYS